MSKSLFNPADQKEIFARLNQLNANSTRNWGKMTVSQMLKHMEIAFSVPINKIQLPKDKLYYLAANPFARFFMIKMSSKWPKNMATVEDFKVKTDPDFTQAKADFLKIYQEFLKATDFSGCHPAFGVMDKDMWGIAMYTHLNHHLEQFGA